MTRYKGRSCGGFGFRLLLPDPGPASLAFVYGAPGVIRLSLHVAEPGRLFLAHRFSGIVRHFGGGDVRYPRRRLGSFGTRMCLVL